MRRVYEEGKQKGSAIDEQGRGCWAEAFGNQARWTMPLHAPTTITRSRSGAASSTSWTDWVAWVRDHVACNGTTGLVRA